MAGAGLAEMGRDVDRAAAALGERIARVADGYRRLQTLAVAAPFGVGVEAGLACGLDLDLDLDQDAGAAGGAAAGVATAGGEPAAPASKRRRAAARVSSLPQFDYDGMRGEAAALAEERRALERELRAMGWQPPSGRRVVRAGARAGKAAAGKAAAAGGDVKEAEEAAMLPGPSLDAARG